MNDPQQPDANVQVASGAQLGQSLAFKVSGEGTLQARYIRGAFDDKPFTLGKYEATRSRVAIAELAANGGAGRPAESSTENIPPAGVRVKRRGKSPPARE